MASFQWGTFAASIYVARFVLALGGMMLTLALHRVLWRHLELIDPLLPLDRGIIASAIAMAVWYGLIHLSTGSMETFRSMELSERERWVYALLGWTSVIVAWLGPALILSYIEEPRITVPYVGH